MKISELPEDIVSQLPISLQLSTDDIDFDDLPSDIQYIIQQPIEEEVVIEYRDKDSIYDVLPQLSVYNDLQITNLRETIISYFKNYLYITVNSYPFDVTVGNYVKSTIHSKDTSLRQTLLGNELKNITSELSAEFDEDISIVNISINDVPRLSTNEHIYTDMNVTLDLELLGEVVTVTQVV
jgi:hypothetical protein